MNTRDFDDYALERGEAFSLAFPALMRKVYVWMAMALCITGLTAYGIASSPNLLFTLYSHSGIIIGLVIAELALVFAISGAINRLSLTTATLLFILYSALTGVTFSSIFVVYTMSSIGKVFFITAGTFAAMAAAMARNDLITAAVLFRANGDRGHNAVFLDRPDELVHSLVIRHLVRVFTERMERVELGQLHIHDLTVVHRARWSGRLLRLSCRWPCRRPWLGLALAASGHFVSRCRLLLRHSLL